jgi:FlaA1/EpsC-like NDP-sugar epimerase
MLTPSVDSLLPREPITLPLPDLAGKAVVVTGSSGFIGTLVSAKLRELGAEVIPFDLDDERSVLRPEDLKAVADADLCLHLAADKHAPKGETIPAQIAHLNVQGTQNVVEAFGSRVVFTSTCKAADAITCYGMSKGIGERIVLNGRGVVVRLVNVIGSSGSVLPIWAQIPASEPIPVCEGTERMWMTPAESVDLTLAASGWPTGRYALDIPAAEPVWNFARRAYPHRELAVVPLRDGDRPTERLVGEYEDPYAWIPGITRIHHISDGPAARAAAARPASHVAPAPLPAR